MNTDTYNLSDKTNNQLLARFDALNRAMALTDEPAEVGMYDAELDAIDAELKRRDS